MQNHKNRCKTFSYWDKVHVVLWNDISWLSRHINFHKRRFNLSNIAIVRTTPQDRSLIQVSAKISEFRWENEHGILWRAWKLPAGIIHHRVVNVSIVRLRRPHLHRSSSRPQEFITVALVCLALTCSARVLHPSRRRIESFRDLSHYRSPKIMTEYKRGRRKADTGLAQLVCLGDCCLRYRVFRNPTGGASQIFLSYWLLRRELI